eukprot:2125629-Pyramimonas_sp.AAC.1
MVAQVSAYSLPFQPTRSVVQGLRSGTRFARCMSYWVLHRLCTVHPSLSERLWIDDLSMRSVGSRRQVRLTMVKGICSAAKYMKSQDLTISPKSTVTCSHSVDTKAVVQQLRRKGIA